jgi:hypothetical protein
MMASLLSKSDVKQEPCRRNQSLRRLSVLYFSFLISSSTSFAPLA